MTTERITFAILVTILLMSFLAIIHLSREIDSCENYSGFCTTLEAKE